MTTRTWLAPTPHALLLACTAALALTACGTDTDARSAWRTDEADAPEEDLPDAPSMWRVPESMTEIPAGAFMMGTPSEVSSSASFFGEAPVHEVYLSRYAIHTLEVTVAEYDACVLRGECTAPQTMSPEDPACNSGNPERLTHPINCVDWAQAMAYCESKGWSLPTEAQWEKAAAGPDSNIYPWGNTPAPSCELAIVNDVRADSQMLGRGCGRSSTWPVGARRKDQSYFGVRDLSGGVQEWVFDAWERRYYSNSPRENPRGPEFSTIAPPRSIRGGSWWVSGSYNSRRISIGPNTKDKSIGFRCVLN